MQSDRTGFLLRYRWIILVASLAVGLFVMIPGQRPQTNQPFLDSAPPVSAGTIAFLSDGGRSIGVGADLDTLAALIQAVVGKDRKAYEALFANGRAFLVNDGVRVRITSLQEETAEVRFLEGYHSLKKGFVSRAWLNAVR